MEIDDRLEGILLDLHYEVHGSGKPVVLVHSGGADMRDWSYLVPLLSENFYVIAFDDRGAGRSPSPVQPPNFVEDLLSLLDHLNISQAAVIGHSMGGQIVLNILHQQPEIADKAVLLCSSSYAKRSRLPLIIGSYIPYFHLYVKFYLARTGIMKNLQNVVHDHTLISDEMLFGYLQPFLKDEIFLALTRMIRDHEGDLSTGALSRITHPCLLIWGEYDRVVPLSVGERLTKDLTRSELVILRDTGHLVPEERPEDVFQHIKQFLA